MGWVERGGCGVGKKMTARPRESCSIKETTFDAIAVSFFVSWSHTPARNTQLCVEGSGLEQLHSCESKVKFTVKNAVCCL